MVTPLVKKIRYVSGIYPDVAGVLRHRAHRSSAAQNLWLKKRIIKATTQPHPHQHVFQLALIELTLLRAMEGWQFIPAVHLAQGVKAWGSCPSNSVSQQQQAEGAVPSWWLGVLLSAERRCKELCQATLGNNPAAKWKCPAWERNEVTYPNCAVQNAYAQG